MLISSLPVGLHPGIAESDYHARAEHIASKSALDAIDRSPAHYLAWRAEPREPTPAMRFGSAFHAALLEPDRFARAYAAEPDFGDCRNKDNKRRRDDWRAEHDGATPISLDDATTIERMVASVRAHPLARAMLVGGEPELTVRWTDDVTGLPCKGRLDYYAKARGLIVDVKTAADASPAAFRRSVADYRYHVQGALYLQGTQAARADARAFVFVVVEKAPPYAVATYMLDAQALSRGAAAARRNLDTLAECIRTNNWPAYPVAIQDLSLPPWAA